MTGAVVLLPTPISVAHIDTVLPHEVITAARRIDHFLAENAKSARAFLKLIGHPRPLRELAIIEIGHQPDAGKIGQWLAPAQAGHDIAIVSEAGCPAVADPGATIVAAAHAAGLRVRPLVGPSAILLALMASGLNGQRFRFHGYLPVDATARSARIRALERDSRVQDETQLFIETPYRAAAMFSSLIADCQPATLILIAADLTGPHEVTRTLSAEQWRAHPRDSLPALAGQATVFALLARS